MWADKYRNTAVKIYGHTFSKTASATLKYASLKLISSSSSRSLSASRVLPVKPVAPVYLIKRPQRETVRPSRGTPYPWRRTPPSLGFFGSFSSTEPGHFCGGARRKPLSTLGQPVHHQTTPGRAPRASMPPRKCGRFPLWPCILFHIHPQKNTVFSAPVAVLSHGPLFPPPLLLPGKALAHKFFGCAGG